MVKREGNEDFDVTIGCCDGAEVFELVGFYLLNKLSKIVNKESFGLYGDDGLAVLQNLSGPQTKRKRKAIMTVFKGCGLRITIQANLGIVNFLDVNLILTLVLTNHL